MRHQSAHDNAPCDVLLACPAERITVFSHMIPLGLASLAAVLEENNYSVRIVDFATYRGDFRRDLRAWKPEVVGIGGTTSTRRGSFLTARLAKEALPEAVVVYGGAHATFTARDTLLNIKEIDFVVRGEGERSFLDLCNHIKGGKDPAPPSIPGLAFRSAGEIVENPVKRIDDLDTLPLPARHLFKKIPRLTLDFLDVEADYLLTSRGCPACCDFCSASRMFPGGVRYRSMAHVAREIDAILAMHRVGGLKLFDSTFTSNPDHVRAFCAMIKPYGLQWECEIRADDHIDHELLHAMKAAGCCYVNMGLETTNPRLLRQSGKHITVSKVESVLDSCRRLGIMIKVFFTFGHLGETYRECLDDIRYMKSQKGRIDFWATTVGLRVYPGTLLEQKARRQALFPPDFSWARFRFPWRNLLVLEFGDVFILSQKQLNFFHFFSIMARLVVQKTVLSREYIVRYVFVQSWIKLAAVLLNTVRYSYHRTMRFIMSRTEI